MTDSAAASVWCTLGALSGVGPARLQKVYQELDRRHSGAEVLIDAQAEELTGFGLSPAIAEAAADALRTPQGYAAPHGGFVLTPDDEDYPHDRLLYGSPPLPAVLFAAGERSTLSGSAVAVVGSRRVPGEVLRIAENVAEAAARAGHVVVSGLAQGVDEAAHAGALRSGGQTIAVLAEGLDRSERGRAARAESEDALLVVSEFANDAEWAAGRAMQRNATVAALADLVIVIASDVKGGTWEMSRICRKHQKRLAVVDLDPGIAPANQRLIAEGAIAIDPNDIAIPPLPSAAEHHQTSLFSY